MTGGIIDMSGTGTLFATPNFVRGMAAAFDIGATMTVYNESKNEVDADIKALSSDWEMIGEDIFTAMERYEVNEK